MTDIKPDILIEIDFFRAEKDLILLKLRDYLETVEKSLDFEENRAWQYSDESLRKSFWWKSKKFDFEYMWPLAKYYSFITLLHLTIEERLRKLCLMVRKYDQHRNEHDLGNGLKNYMGFLEAGNRYVINRKEIATWPAITDFEKVRDCLVHAYGRIEYVKPVGKRMRLQQLLKLDKSLFVETHYSENQLMPSRKYCENAVSMAREFFDQICNRLIEIERANTGST